ncbi:MAG: efflux RND transporter permease subunit [Thermodesulfobacteriota bacterium]
MFLPEFSIKKPVTTFMIMAAIFVFGAIGFSRLGVDQYPRVDFPVVTVITVFEGASPEVVEENVTDIIEEEVATIEGIRNLTSTSSHGASIVTIEFKMERDIDIAAQDVRDKVNGVLRELPDESDVPVVDKLDIQGSPIMWIAVSGERPIQEITGFADDVLKVRLETIEGVGSIMVGGKRERVIRVWLDRAKLEARALTADDVVEALQRENVEIPGGILVSSEMEFAVKTEGELPTVAAFNDLIVAWKGGSPVRLRDVGHMEDGLEDKRGVARYSGEPAVGLGIRKKAGANTVKVARAIKAEVERSMPDVPPGMKVQVAFDSSTFIEDAMEEMEFALIFGGILAALVVFLFLRNVVAMLITGVTIPLAMVGALLFVYFLGFTLNTMTMLALTLAIGVVVDDAVIILESIYRHGERGTPMVESARAGAGELAFAAIASTLSLAAVFVPVAFMKGLMGKFFYEFGITVAIAVSLSTFIALTFTPMLSSRFLKVRKKEIFSTTTERPGLFKRVEGLYRRLLALVLRHRVLVVSVALVVFVLSLGIWTLLGKEFIPPEDQSRFIVNFETPIGSSIDYTDAKLAHGERVLKGLPEIKGFFAAIGLGEAGRVNSGLMFVRMHPPEDRERAQSAVIGQARREINSEPGLRAFVGAMSFGFGGGHRGSPLEFTIKGPTIEGLDAHSGEIVKRFEKIPGIVDVDTNLDIGLPELRVNIDRNRAADLGVDTTRIASTINTLIGGRDVTRFKEAGKRYDVRVKLIESQRTVPEDVGELMVRARDGRLVKLSNMVTVKEEAAPSVINRKDRQRSVTISSNLEDGKTLGSAIEDISAIAAEVLPEGYTTRLEGRAELFKESMASIMVALFLAVIVIYMVLGSQFESFIHPFTVMLSLPLSVVGALGSLWLTGNTLNIFSLIGVILLVGLVTKNSIILVDYTNRLRRGGMEMHEAILEAGPIRLRPILMTAFSTVFGVLPTAVGIGPGSEARAPMAIAVIGGMATSTFLTLLVVPVVYTLVDDLKGFFITGKGEDISTGAEKRP